MRRLSLTVISLLLIFTVKAHQFLSLAGEARGKSDYTVISDIQKPYLLARYAGCVDIQDKPVNGSQNIPYFFKSKDNTCLFEIALNKYPLEGISLYFIDDGPTLSNRRTARPDFSGLTYGLSEDVYDMKHHVRAIPGYFDSLAMSKK